MEEDNRVDKNPVIEDEKWFVVHTYSGYENKVAENIKKVAVNREMDKQRKILDAVVPTETVQTNDGKGGKKTITRKIYPGYVFVKMGVYYTQEENEKIGRKYSVYKMTDDAWYVVRNTRGVTGFVGPESKPRYLSDEEARSLNVERKEVEVSYEAGDSVEILDELFSGSIGTVVSVDIPANTVTVKISMMGQDTQTELPLDKVKKVED